MDLSPTNPFQKFYTNNYHTDELITRRHFISPSETHLAGTLHFVRTCMNSNNRFNSCCWEDTLRAHV